VRERRRSARGELREFQAEVEKGRRKPGSMEEGTYLLHSSRDLIGLGDVSDVEGDIAG